MAASARWMERGETSPRLREQVEALFEVMADRFMLGNPLFERPARNVLQSENNPFFDHINLVDRQNIRVGHLGKSFRLSLQPSPLLGITRDVEKL